MARGEAGARTAGRIAALSPRRLAAWLPALRHWFVAGVSLEAERRRLFPWLAVAFGAGILVYFSATVGEPVLAAPLGSAALLAALVPVCAARPVLRALLLGLVAALLGFAAGAWRVATVASPILARTTIAPLTGFIESLDEREEGARLIIRVESFGSLAAEARPTRVRASYKASRPLKPGDFIAANARLLPPPEAARPGGYDFGRDAFFRGLGAVGSLVGKIEVKPPPGPLPVRLRAAAAVDDARNALTRRITDAIGGQAGAVAAALVTGKRGLIDQQTNDVLRDAGIYHVVSISGLHMVLAAGVVFWLVRAILAAVPFLALRTPIKKIAAAFAMVGVTAYCVFSGWDIAAERAWIMTLVMLGAILVDRPALSMRNLALAALIALAREPEGLLGPSFQMSFGAVAGLIACAVYLDGSGLRREADGRVARAMATVAAAVVGTLATTLVAQIATAPFSTYHFQAVQPFGLVGNALTLPLVSLAVMPAAVLGILAYPFALDQPVWWLMGLAVQGMLAISAWISGFGHASVMVPAFGAGALACLAAALIVLALPVSSLRWLGLLPAAIGVALAAIPMRNDIYVDREGAGAAVRDRSGRLAALGRPPAFVMEQWLKADGDSRQAKDVIAASPARCDRLGCTMEAQDGRRIALLKDRRGFREDCVRADILISRLEAPTACAAAVIVDRRFLRDHGATAIRLTDGAPTLTTARAPGITKPWRPSTVAPRLAPTPDPVTAPEATDDETVPDTPSSSPAERLQ
ncbi:competence protein ComEC [Methylobacterium sp. Leaf399]|uniref:ComEC/Rec2 family competence protein n=1 Tax=Methylobacterium sp. Leaf399 TaxID=1736364 RepID=UPI0006F5427A|nr:ComEC/Rec2 family competence protein [Methylobacterium sp. Leaf399]KQT11756.1 competence protein ComEC [Methylobacterium sp. Leaf399]